MVHGKLKRGLLLEASVTFSCSISTIKKFWYRAKNTFTQGLPADISRRLKGTVGRKRIELDRKEVSQVPLRCRTNIRSLASALNMAKSTIHRRIEEGDMRSLSNAIKPQLTDGNKLARLAFDVLKFRF